MQFNWTSHLISRRLATRVLVLTSIVVTAPPAAFAQSSNLTPRVIADGSLGTASYWDDFQVFGTAFGASARLYVTPRIAIGPEVTFVRPNESSTASQLIVLGVGSIDLHQGLSAPFVTIGGGMMHRSSSNSLADANGGALVAGFGWRLGSRSASRGWYVAPEFRAVIFDDVQWQPRVNVGYRF